MACVTACPSGRAVRQAHRGRPGPRSSAATARPAATGRCARLIFSLFPHPRRLRLLRGPLRALPGQRADRRCVRTGLLERLSPQLAAMESLAPRLRQAASRCRARIAAPRRAPGGRRACSPAACRARSSRASTPRPPGCCRPRAATSSSRGAGLLRRAVGAQRPRGGGAAVRPAADRHLRGRRRRARRGQRRRLRLDA